MGHNIIRFQFYSSVLYHINIIYHIVFMSFPAFCIMIEFAVYAGATDAYSDYYSGGYSGAFAITIIDFVLCIVIGVIGVIDWLGLVCGMI